MFAKAPCFDENHTLKSLLLQSEPWAYGKSLGFLLQLPINQREKHNITLALGMQGVPIITRIGIISIGDD
jgi:hypothetical protein